MRPIMMTPVPVIVVITRTPVRTMIAVVIIVIVVVAVVGAATDSEIHRRRRRSRCGQCSEREAGKKGTSHRFHRLTPFGFAPLLTQESTSADSRRSERSSAR